MNLSPSFCQYSLSLSLCLTKTADCVALASRMWGCCGRCGQLRSLGAQSAGPEEMPTTKVRQPALLDSCACSVQSRSPDTFPRVLDSHASEGPPLQGLGSSRYDRMQSVTAKLGMWTRARSPASLTRAWTSAPASPNSGSEASWAMEPKEKKHKSRFAKLFHRKPKNHAASSDATSVASSQASESSRYQVRNQSRHLLFMGLQLA